MVSLVFQLSYFLIAFSEEVDALTFSTHVHTNKTLGNVHSDCNAPPKHRRFSTDTLTQLRACFESDRFSDMTARRDNDMS